MVKSKKSVLKNRLKTLVKAGALMAALTVGGTKANAAVGSPARRAPVCQTESTECVQPTAVTYTESVVECEPAPVQCEPAPVQCEPAPVQRVETPQRCRPVRTERCQPTRSTSYQHSETHYESSEFYQSSTSSHVSYSSGGERPTFGRGSRSLTPVSTGYVGGSTPSVQTGTTRGTRSMFTTAYTGRGGFTQPSVGSRRGTGTKTTGSVRGTRSTSVFQGGASRSGSRQTMGATRGTRSMPTAAYTGYTSSGSGSRRGSSTMTMGSARGTRSMPTMYGGSSRSSSRQSGRSGSARGGRVRGPGGRGRGF